MKKVGFISLLLILVVLSMPILAQSLDDNMAAYKTAKQAAKGYAQPLVDAFSANLNTSLYHNAKIKGLGLQFYLGLETMSAIIPESAMTFTTSTEGLLGEGITVSPEEIESATVFGAEDGGATITGSDGSEFTLPGGFDLKFVPVATPQLTIGSFLGTDITLRYIDQKVNDEIGQLTLFSWGVRHSISRHIPLLPVNIAVGFYQQSFTLGDIVEAKANYIGAMASRRLGILTLYGGLGMESGNMKFSYNIGTEAEPELFSFRMKPRNSARMTLGFALTLLGVNIHADYNIARQSTVGLGVGFGIGQ